MRILAHIGLIAFLSLTLALAHPAAAQSYQFSAAKLMVPIDSSTSQNNNAVGLVDSPGNVTFSTSGTPIFGGFPGETYTSAVIQYRDASGEIQYATVPTDGSTTLSGASHYDYAFLTDTDRSDDTGTMSITESNSSGTLATGVINGASQTSAMTGIATSTNQEVSTDHSGLTTISLSGSRPRRAIWQRHRAIPHRFDRPILLFGNSHRWIGNLRRRPNHAPHDHRQHQPRPRCQRNTLCHRYADGPRTGLPRARRGRVSSFCSPRRQTSQPMRRQQSAFNLSPTPSSVNLPPHDQTPPRPPFPILRPFPAHPHRRAARPCARKPAPLQPHRRGNE